MQFKEWFLLNEIQHISFPAHMVNGILADHIDMRFEDYKKGSNPAKGLGPIMPFNAQPFLLDAGFRAKIQEGWIVNPNQRTNTFRSGGLALATRTQPSLQTGVVTSLDQESLKLPELGRDWFRFAILYHGNQVVKEPEWPRGEYEMLKHPVRTQGVIPLRTGEEPL